MKMVLSFVLNVTALQNILIFFEAEHQGKTYTVHWNIKCPNCHEYTIIKETYTLTDVEKEW